MIPLFFFVKRSKKFQKSGTIWNPCTNVLWTIVLSVYHLFLFSSFSLSLLLPAHSVFILGPSPEKFSTWRYNFLLENYQLHPLPPISASFPSPPYHLLRSQLFNLSLTSPLLACVNTSHPINIILLQSLLSLILFAIPCFTSASASDTYVWYHSRYLQW